MSDYVLPGGGYVPAVTNTYTTSNTAGPFGTLNINNRPLRVGDNDITSEDLKLEVYNAKIEDLVNLWVARFGNEWVDLVDIERDNFFMHAYQRLRQLGQLEQHYLTDRSRFVCRKPE